MSISANNPRGESAVSSGPLGLPSAFDRNLDSATIVSAVEQLTGGETVLTFATITLLSSGRLGPVREQGSVRLTPQEREDLIAKLMDHRFVGIAADLGGGNGGGTR
jgi:hypothetical protein